MNCALNFRHFEQDDATGDLKYAFRVTYPDQHEAHNIVIGGDHLESTATLNRTLLKKTKFRIFNGGEGDKSRLIGLWRKKRSPVVRTIPYIGYDKKSQAYIYQRFAVQGGRVILPNEDGYIHLGRRHGGIRTTLTEQDPAYSDRYDTGWFPDYRAAYGPMGLAALGFWLMTLLAQQIRAKQPGWPFLEAQGEPGSGKTTLIRTLWKLFGMDAEGFDANKTRLAGRRDTFAQGSNWPAVLIEMDRDEEEGRRMRAPFSYEELKPMYDDENALGIKGLPGRGLDTDTPKWRGALVIIQNHTVVASPAVLERIVHVPFTKAHHRTENKARVDRLRFTPKEELCGFHSQALLREKEI